MSGNYGESSQQGSSSTTGQSAIWPQLESIWQDTVNEIQEGGAPTQDFNQMQEDAMAQAGLEGAAGQFYQGQLSGQGQQDRYNALQDLNSAAATQASQGLEGALAAQGLDFTATGGSGGSRHGVAQGVATSQAMTNLSAIQAQNNQNFLNNEQNIMTNAANQVMNIANQQFGYGTIQQQQDFQNQFGQTSAGKLAYLSQFVPALGGLAGSSQTNSTGSGSGWGIGQSAKFGWG